MHTKNKDIKQKTCLRTNQHQTMNSLLNKIYKKKYLIKYQILYASILRIPKNYFRGGTSSLVGRYYIYIYYTMQGG